MEIIVAKRAGFCFGVRRAVGMAFKVADRANDEPVCTLGPIIHNPQLVERLKDRGVQPVQDMDDLKRKKCGTVIIRTHGITVRDALELQKGDYELIDATCPFVKKAQYYAKLLQEEGYKVVILGDKDHPEVKSLMSHAGENAIVVSDADHAPKLTGKIGIVVQTTQQVQNLKRFLERVVEHAKEIKVYNTICNSTALRLKETEKIARSVDAIVIVGGKNSANTTQLATLCRNMSVPTYHIETSDQLEENWFDGVHKVGITAGASTPDWLIEEAIHRIENIGGGKSL